MKSSITIKGLTTLVKERALAPLQFQQLILDWFDRNGRKHLPWQEHRTPYRTWVSEIMLQQTQVNTVIPYFNQFMLQFPLLQDLANAQEDHVLHAWSGLGYYSRARNLHKAANKIINAHQGIFPSTLDSLISLPGIGRSTAGAILSIAYGKPAPILDGNVKRVLSRFVGAARPLNEKSTEAMLWKFAEEHVSSERPGDYTQAMMDLGAIVCTRKAPACHSCPLMAHCVAYSQGTTDQLPVKKASKPLPKRSATFILLQRPNGSLLLQKRPAKGIWGGLWSFPEIPGKLDERALRQYCEQSFDFKLGKYQLLRPLKHTFTHFQLTLFPVLVPISKQLINHQLSPLSAKGKQQLWYGGTEKQALGLPKPIQTLIRNVTTTAFFF